MDAAPTRNFEDECREAMTALRASLLDLYRSVSADPAKPQEVSRRFGVNRNLAWQVSRILLEEDALRAVPLVPRAGAVDIMLHAMRTAGAAPEEVESARRAFGNFDAMVEAHAGDRAELELLLDSMGRGLQQGLEMSRRLAFRGNSGLWGIQVSTRISAQFIAPGMTDPEMLDAAQVAGLSRVRRFRSTPPWPVFRIGRFVDGAGQVVGPDRTPIDPDPGEHFGLIQEFSEGVLPPLQCTQRGDGLYYTIGDGPVGLLGEFSCYFGYLQSRFVPRYARRPDGAAILAAPITMPAEALHFDLFVHEAIECEVCQQAEIFGKLWDEAGGFDETAKLPIAANLIDLGRGVHPGSPRVPRYDEVIARVFHRANWDPRAFRCYRLLVDYPPMSSVAAISIRLPVRGPACRDAD